jgi:hypothetical protein
MGTDPAPDRDTIVHYFTLAVHCVAGIILDRLCKCADIGNVIVK